MRFHSVFIILLSAVICLLQACSTLPERHAVTASYTNQISTENSYLTHLVTPVEAIHPNKTGYHLLYSPNQALDTRIQLINVAEKSLDLQYYIWDNDQVGTLALEAILRAADRGVKVRLLIDDNNSASLQASYRAMVLHPNIQIRMFNPYRFRKMRGLDILFDYGRISRRMHNKSFIADQQVALIGGRNMSNHYYDVGDNFQFSDMDVVLLGEAVHEISASFDEYWNHEYAYPIQQLAKYNPKRLSYQNLRQQLQKNWQKTASEGVLRLDTTHQSFEQWYAKDMRFSWVNARVVKDSANKINQEIPSEENLSFQLQHLIQKPTAHVDLVSAYFVPDDEARKLLKKMSQDGVKIRVLTNSFKANDVPLVHAFYMKHRKELLKSGIQLYEFLPVFPATLDSKYRTELFGEKKFNRKGFSRSSLHAKFLALDDQQVFIGSFNFDPRSAYLNTEIGVILDSPNLAKGIRTSMDEDLLKFSYQVQLTGHNQLLWKTVSADGIEKYRSEPYVKWWHKIGLKIASWLPIEGQL